MPKDDGQPRDHVSTVEAAAGGGGTTSSSSAASSSKPKKTVGQSSAASVLKRNQACLNCRKRKLKCDAVRPICNTCTRSYNHALQHAKPGDPPPPPPSCSYEDPPEPAPAPAGPSGSPASSVSALETRVRELEAMLSQAAAVSGLGALALAREGGAGETSGPMDGLLSSGFIGNRAQQENAMAGPSGAQQQEHSHPAHQQHRHNTYPGALASGGISGQTYQSSVYSPFPPVQGRAPQPMSVDPSLPPAASFPPPPSRAAPPAQPPSSGSNGSWDPPLAQYAAAAIDTFPPQQQQQPSAAIIDPSESFRSLYATLPDPKPSPPPPSNFVEPPPPQVNASLSDYIERNRRFPPYLRLDTAEPTPPAPPATTTQTTRSNGYLNLAGQDPGWLFRDPQGVAALESAASSRQAKLNGVRETEESPPSGDELHDLLWPGYPPHLPPPAMLERCVETFFNKYPMAPHILDKGKFLARLALPPTHDLYPHPAVLHAMCAVSAFWLGDIYLVPSSERALFTNLSERTKSNKNALSVDRRPRWDGLGPPPANARQGIDGDFGEVHFTWGRLYVDDDLASPPSWYSVVLASVILGQYCHMSSRWVDGWMLVALASRLAVPMTLHLRTPSAPGLVVWTKKPTLLQEAADATEQRERDNLWWFILSLDAHASTSSTWPGSADELATSIPIPGDFGATVLDSHARATTQTVHSPDLFVCHPPGTTSFTLLIKSALLLRKVNKLIRFIGAATSSFDPRSSTEFRALDELITAFRVTFPPEFRNPLRGNAVDTDLYAAHCNSLLCCIQLHELFADPRDESNASNARIVASARGMLGFVHVIQATPFDLTLLYPFTSYAFMTAARIQLRWLQVALEMGDSNLEAALRAEINVFRNALFAIGEKLPIGSRQGRMLEKLIEDITLQARDIGPNVITQYLQPSYVPSPSHAPSPSSSFAANATPAPVVGTIVELSPPTSSNTPSTGPEPPTFHPSPWSQHLASMLDGELSTLGAPVESWMDDETMKELGYGFVAEGRPSPLSYLFSPGTPSMAP